MAVVEPRMIFIVRIMPLKLSRTGIRAPGPAATPKPPVKGEIGPLISRAFGQVSVRPIPARRIL
ncbi:hypothetical protein [Nonomuraea sp. NPDC003201]